MFRCNNDVIIIYSILLWIEDNLELFLLLEKVFECFGYFKWYL